MSQRLFLVSTLGAAVALTACAGMSSHHGNPAMGRAPVAAFTQDGLPDGVKVPAGHRIAWETVGVGEITYECRPKADAASAYEWVFVGPKADLKSRHGQVVGRYWGPPATWAARDGSSVTGKQLAVAPAGPGHIPLQLVQANPAMGAGEMTGVSYIQRVATRGGVAPSLPCTAEGLGRQEVVQYQADYIFWKPV